MVGFASLTESRSAVGGGLISSRTKLIHSRILGFVGSPGTLERQYNAGSGDERSFLGPPQVKQRDDELNGDFHIYMFLQIYAYYMSLKRTY